MPLLPDHIEQIPAALARLDQWVVWQSEQRTPGSKPTKVPYQPNNLAASTTNPYTWSSLAEALRVQSRFAGIGFVLTKDDPYIGVDLDYCFDADGTLTAWAVDLVALANDLGLYVERSPSGRGLHIIGRATLHGPGRKVSLGNGAAVETYDRGRYLTITGDQQDLGDPDQDATPLLLEIQKRYWINGTEQTHVEPGIAVSDERAAQMTERLLHHASDSFRHLWEGDFTPDEIATPSEARMRLLTHIAMSMTDERYPTPQEVKAIALRSPHIKREIHSRGTQKWPRLADAECLKAVQWAMQHTNPPPEQAPPDAAPQPEPTIAFARRLDIAKLASTKAAPPRFIIDEWLPPHAVTLFSAHGSAGKSQIALFLAICLAAGIPFMGRHIARPYKTLVYSCEDDEGVMHWRVQQICEALGVKLASLAPHLILEDATEADNAMYQEAFEPARRLTASYRRLEQSIRDDGIEVCIIDNTSDVYAANEINRAQVRDFITKLKRLATLPAEGAVLLLGHANREATRNAVAGQMYSGSTAWHNSVRSRWELTPEAAVGTDDPDRRRVLTCVKSNYGAEGQAHVWTWNHKHSVFVPTEAVTRATPSPASIDDAVLAALRDIAVTLRTRVFPVKVGATSARSTLAPSPHFPKGLGADATVESLMRLVAAGRAKLVEYRGPNRAVRSHVVPEDPTS